MYYDINVSKNGKHYFATDERSATTLDETTELVNKFRECFPKEDDYEISVTFWKKIGETVEI